MGAVDATTVAEAAVAATVIVGYMGYLGVRRNSETTLLISEQRRLDECHEAIETLKTERDRERQRADLLAVELAQYRMGSIGGMEQDGRPRP